MATIRDLISDVLSDIGYLGVGDDLQPEDSDYCLRRLNQWLSALTLQPLALYYVLRTVKALAANVATLTVGTGGDINIVRPDHLERVGLIINNLTPPTEIRIDDFTDQQWQNLPQKTLTGPLLLGVYYDRNFVAGLATLHVFPVPTVGTTQLVLYTLQAFTAFLASDDVILPPGYEEMIRLNLAVRVARNFGKAATQDDWRLARESLGIVKRANIRPVEARLPADTPGLSPGAVYDWRSDTYRT